MSRTTGHGQEAGEGYTYGSSEEPQLLKQIEDILILEWKASSCKQVQQKLKYSE